VGGSQIYDVIKDSDKFGIVSKEKHMRKSIYIKVAACLVLMWVGVGMADEVAETVRVVSASHHDAVLLTNVVIEMYESERKYEGIATVIDPSGLAIMSLSSIDPASTSSYLSEQDTKIKDIKYVTREGDEIPAKVVLRDKDLDLAFIRPVEKPSEPFSSIDINDYMVPEIMDHVIILSRLGSIAGNVPMVSEARLQAIIEKPRIVYMPEPFAGLVSGMGTPVFSMDGKFVGILLLRVSKSRDMGTSDMSGGIASLGMLPVILPAQEIIEVIEKTPDLK
jgi:hypothetical protein